MQDKRQSLIHEFLISCEIENYKLVPLAQDASFRRYFRIYYKDKTYILMDAPPEHEDVKPFIKVARHLISLKLKAPSICHFDTNSGFILLEDFGDNTFTRLLNQGFDESELYETATDCLIELHKHPQATTVDLQPYSNQLLINEALLLTDRYYPNVTGNQIDDKDRTNYIELWHTIFENLPNMDDTLVLRDFHVDNLIKLETGVCGLLDFQDAVIGSPAYDLVSLLEDARRDISTQRQTQMLNRYFSAIEFDQKVFMRWYSVLGAQRHCKVLGIFTRLSVRDGKHQYLKHLPRVKRLLLSHLDQPDLLPLRNWLETVGLT